ncbi:hypothetical protein [Cutibacterium avidum]|uniref:hypothetical protein n=1 Tax=Cutibacterium avidum TaxID=33010 RepID=UPI002FF42690
MARQIIIDGPHPVRRTVGLVLTLVIIGLLVAGFATGFLPGLWHQIVGWLNEPWDVTHLLKAGGALLIPIIGIIALVVIIDDL